MRPRGKRAVVVLAAVLCAVVAAGGIDAMVLGQRLRHTWVVMPQAGAGTTWLLVGSDAWPTPHDAPRFSGQRADVILLVHAGPPRGSVISVPRDLLLSTAQGGVERAALAFEDGPQQLVDGLCRTLGVGVSHLAILTRAGFADVVDAAGGVTVRLKAPVRDPTVDLELARAGEVHLDGSVALALVRSRHPQYLIDGRWVGLGEHAGARARARNAGAVFSALRAALGDLRADPVRLQRVLWAVTGALTLDQNTGLTDLFELLHGSGRLRVLPTARLPLTIATQPDARTRAVLAASGYSGTCTPVW